MRTLGDFSVTDKVRAMLLALRAVMLSNIELHVQHAERTWRVVRRAITLTSCIQEARIERGSVPDGEAHAHWRARRITFTTFFTYSP